jgi:Ca2+-binding RTX toxin-like protein
LAQPHQFFRDPLTPLALAPSWSSSKRSSAMYVTLTDPSVAWHPTELVPVTEPYSEEDYPEGKFLFSGDGYTVDFGDSGTFFHSDEILGKSIGTLLDTVPDISLLYVIAHGDAGYTITGSSRHERFYSSAGDDLIRGGGGDDEIWARREDFEPRPVDGDDILIGGAGADVMHAGSGSDIFVFDKADGVATDEIWGLSAEDMILVEGAIYDSNRDGVITFGGDKKLDLPSKGEVAIYGENGKQIRALEFDGQATFDGVSYYVYSLVGSADTMQLAEARL